MGEFVNAFKGAWLLMLTPPWKLADPDLDGGEKAFHVMCWLVGWTWAFAGIIFAAILSPYFVEVFGITDSSYQETILIGIVTITGFLVQFLGWSLVILFLLIAVFLVAVPTNDKFGITDDNSKPFSYAVVLLTAPVPLALLGYAIFWYSSRIGLQAGLVSTAAIGGALLKLTISLGVPLLKSLILGVIFARFMIWLRGGNKK